MPEPMILETGARIMALDEPTQKMSKSAPTPAGYIALLDEPDVIRRKIRRARTDSSTEVTATPDKPALTNLLGIYASLTNRPVPKIEDQYRGKGYGDFKKDLAEVVVEALSPIRERTLELLDDDPRAGRGPRSRGRKGARCGPLHPARRLGQAGPRLAEPGGLWRRSKRKSSRF